MISGVAGRVKLRVLTRIRSGNRLGASGAMEAVGKPQHRPEEIPALSSEVGSRSGRGMKGARNAHFVFLLRVREGRARRPDQPFRGGAVYFDREARGCRTVLHGRSGTCSRACCHAIIRRNGDPSLTWAPT